MAADRQTSFQASEAVAMRWARHWESMRRLVWEPEDVLSQLWRIDDINAKLVTSMNDGALLPGESKTGDWLRLLSVDELILIQAFADLHQSTYVQSRAWDHPKIRDFVVLLFTLVLLEKGPLHRSRLSFESVRMLSLRLLCATRFEVLARKGYLQIDEEVQLTGTQEGAGICFKIRLPLGNVFVKI